MQRTSGVLVGPSGLRVEWRGIALEPTHGLLEVPASVGSHQLWDPPPNQSRVGLDGAVQLLERGRVQLTAPPSLTQHGEDGDSPAWARAARKGVGPFAGWIVHVATCYRIAWRGTGVPVVCEAVVPTVRFPCGYQVTFNSHGLTARGRLEAGEVVLDALPPKSRQRRLRRARMAGGWEADGGRLLRYTNPEDAVWPPRERNRNKRGRQPTRAWDQSYAERRYY